MGSVSTRQKIPDHIVTELINIKKRMKDIGGIMAIENINGTIVKRKSSVDTIDRYL